MGILLVARSTIQDVRPLLQHYYIITSLTHYSVTSAKQHDQASKTISNVLIPNESSTTDINDNDPVIDDNNNVSVVDLIPVVDGEIPDGIPLANG